MYLVMCECPAFAKNDMILGHPKVLHLAPTVIMHYLSVCSTCRSTVVLCSVPHNCTVHARYS